jgi:hypothetical protein
MKRFICCLAVLCLLLTGCAKSIPESAADGAAWDKGWTTLGGVLGVEEPGHDLELRDNNEALSVSDMYLASWTIGEGAPYVNEDGDEVVLYPARLDVLVYGRKNADAAQQAVDDWTARQAETYNVASSQTQTCGGQDYTISAYTCKSDANPYSRGVSAFGVYSGYAISAELNCLDSFTGDEASILTDFLDGCHYAA